MGIPIIDDKICAADLDRMMESATDASNFLKAISHEGRLMILCHLSSGEKSVTEFSAPSALLLRSICVSHADVSSSG